MDILTATTGIFPKIGGDAPSLRANLHKFDREEISENEIEEIIQKNIERAVREQLDAGIDLPTDGLIRWTDLFSPFVKAWDGLTRRGIHRFYDTNTLYGEPVVEGELKFNPSHAASDFAIAQKAGAKKATLPGVFTFAAACVDNFYQDEQKLRAVIAENLLKEAQALVEAGAEFIEIHEPELGWNMEHETRSMKHEAINNEVVEIYSKFSKLHAKIVVVSYFRNFSQEIANALVEAGCGIGLDFSRPDKIDSLPDGSILQAGVINSRETKLEQIGGEIADLKTIISKNFSNCEIIFSTTSHVEYLPHEIALQKIALLKNFKITFY
ncbi:MAG: hypothetical protein K9L85_03080 [Candidatus Peribacteraceae bacterium]|nr:hypothetical protein [Candidatus Peribacteraceae bacterium]